MGLSLSSLSLLINPLVSSVSGTARYKKSATGKTLSILSKVITLEQPSTLFPLRLTPITSAEVIGVNRRGKSVDGCSKVITFDKIDKVLPVADFLYLAVPETEETKGLINKERLDRLKPTCGIVNIGRQSVLDYEAS